MTAAHGGDQGSQNVLIAFPPFDRVLIDWLPHLNGAGRPHGIAPRMERQALWFGEWITEMPNRQFTGKWGYVDCEGKRRVPVELDSIPSAPGHPPAQATVYLGNRRGTSCLNDL